MATSAEPRYFNELIRILDSAYSRDSVSIARTAESIANKYESKGFGERSEKIKNRVAKLMRSSSNSQLAPLHDTGKNIGLDVFDPTDSATKSKGYVIGEKNKKVMNELIQVMKNKEAFWEAEMPLPNKTLMFGPPGTGKTTCAHFISNSLNLPLLLVRLDSLISGTMGSTARNLRKIFDLSNKQPCVLFLDEFDAIATNRKKIASSEVGSEVSRIVNSLLQNIDSLNDEVLLFAATNLDTEIDPAVWRRFQNRMEFFLPNENEMIEYLNRNLKDMFLVEQVFKLFANKSFAETEIVLNRSKTKSILYGKELTAEIIEESVKEQLEQRLEKIH